MKISAQTVKFPGLFSHKANPVYLHNVSCSEEITLICGSQRLRGPCWENCTEDSSLPVAPVWRWISPHPSVSPRSDCRTPSLLRLPSLLRSEGNIQRKLNNAIIDYIKLISLNFFLWFFPCTEQRYHCRYPSISEGSPSRSWCSWGRSWEPGCICWVSSRTSCFSGRAAQTSCRVPPPASPAWCAGPAG